MAAVDNRRNRVSKYVTGHNAKIKPPMKGRKHTDEARAKLASYNGQQASSYKHGWSRTITYKSWKCMWERCYDSRNASWKYYGARGITVCDRWRDDFEAFLEDMGERPAKEYTIDRIDADGNYEPSNCRWLHRREQNARRADPGGWVRRRAQSAQGQPPPST